MKTLPPLLPHNLALATSATALFERLCLTHRIAALFALAGGYDRCWSRCTTLLAMVLGHLSGDCRLGAALPLMRSGIADRLLSKGRKMSLLLADCTSTSALAQARKRLPLPWLRRLLAEQVRELRSLASGWQWLGLDVHVLDGTMMTMRPHGCIPKSYPPHSNQHGKTYWCQMRVLVCLCLGTGLIVGHITGHAGDSEQAQMVRLILYAMGSWQGCATGSILWMGDANKSPSMAKRELITGMIAYNLVRGLMLMAAAQHGRAIWRLSFAHARRDLVGTLMKCIDTTAEQRQALWQALLRRVHKAAPPPRKKPRPSEPRRQRHRRNTFPPLVGDRQAARELASAETYAKS